MIIEVKMKCGDIIVFETDTIFENISEDILNRQWSRVVQKSGVKIVFNRDDIKYITHE
jgi:hypothetical protein